MGQILEILGGLGSDFRTLPKVKINFINILERVASAGQIVEFGGPVQSYRGIKKQGH